MSNPDAEQLRRSWIANASAWSETVRERKIESRRLATDAAILDAVLDLHPTTALDLGCGEGWLSRALAEHGVTVTGIDGSPDLIESARELGGGQFQAVSYQELIADPAFLGETFDVIVANFSLLDDQLHELLSALRSALRPEGSLVIQTVHPPFATGELPYRDGWRVEKFSSLPGDWSEPMPWYFRTLTSWVDALDQAGYAIRRLREPLHPERLQPLSMILVCRPL